MNIKQYKHDYYLKNKERINKQHGDYYILHKKEIAMQHQTKIARQYRKEATLRHNMTEKKKVSRKKYQQSKKGKEKKAKVYSKRRKLGFEKIYDNPFTESEEINWHHINDTEVIALPKDLHLLYMGKNHREDLTQIINQIYGGV